MVSLINDFDARYGLAPPDDSVMAYLTRNAPGPRANHMAEADAVMSLSPEEKYLYNTHLANLNGPGKVVHPMGDISSLYQMSFERDGKTYNIPTIWGGKALPPDDAVRAAEATGLDRFPSYATPEEAADRYEQLHDYLARDTNDFRGQR